MINSMYYIGVQRTLVLKVDIQIREKKNLMCVWIPSNCVYLKINQNQMEGIWQNSQSLTVSPIKVSPSTDEIRPMMSFKSGFPTKSTNFPSIFPNFSMCLTPENSRGESTRSSRRKKEGAGSPPGIWHGQKDASSEPLWNIVSLFANPINLPPVGRVPRSSRPNRTTEITSTRMEPERESRALRLLAIFLSAWPLYASISPPFHSSARQNPLHAPLRGDSFMLASSTPIPSAFRWRDSGNIWGQGR